LARHASNGIFEEYIMNYQEAFIWGALGAAASEFVYWANFQKTFHRKRPAHASSWFYWVIASIWVAVGGLLPCGYVKAAVTVNFVFCIHVGASAPVFLNQFLKGKVAVS